MSQPLSGGWERRNTVGVTVPLVPGLDPEHATPTDNPEFVQSAPTWQSTVNQPFLPEELFADPRPAELATGYGTDETPEDHSYGMGIGPGLTTLESQDRSGMWHEQDHGTVFAETWTPMIDRDGAPHLAIIPDPIGEGDSPATVDLQRTGVGAPSDGGLSRRAKRQKRWYDRYIDRHMWGVEQSPYAPKSARQVPSRGAVPAGGPGVSPFPNNAAFDVGSPDRFVAPLVRRIPGAWDETLATDGSAQVGDVGNAYGLTKF